MTIDALLAIFFTSLFGSSHCVGMCGGFVALYSLGGSDKKTGPGLSEGWARHGLYNGGRLVSYLVLGGIAGGLGSVLDKSILEHFHLSSAIVAGGVIIFWGASMIALSLGFRAYSKRIPKFLSRIKQPIAKLYHTFLGKPGKRSALILGLCTGLLPCGWLYLFVAAAAATSSVYSGVLVMFAFWLGTVPAMLVFGGVAYKLTTKLRRQLPILSGVLMILLGVFTVSGRLAPHDHSQHGATVGSNTDPSRHHHHHAQ